MSLTCSLRLRHPQQEANHYASGRDLDHVLFVEKIHTVGYDVNAADAANAVFVALTAIIHVFVHKDTTQTQSWQRTPSQKPLQRLQLDACRLVTTISHNPHLHQQ